MRLKQFPPSFSIDEGSSTDPEKNLKCEVFTVRKTLFLLWRLSFSIQPFQADQEIEFKWFSRPEDEEDKKVMNPVCAQVLDPPQPSQKVLLLFIPPMTLPHH